MQLDKAYLIALGAILGPFLGISFSLIAIEYTKVGIAAAGQVVYKEKLTWRAILGAFVVVAGVAILFLR